MKENIDSKVEIHKSTIIVENFNTSPKTEKLKKIPVKI